MEYTSIEDVIEIMVDGVVEGITQLSHQNKK